MPPISEPVTTADIALRLVAATLIGAAVGLNRQIVGKPAGLRTHALVSLGAAAVILIGSGLAGDSGTPGRIMQGVVAGIGFVGGGVILHDRRSVHGLTTAASIWVVATAGLAAGSGQWATAVIVAALALVVLIAGQALDQAIERGERPRARNRRDPD
jgi:putative Mg2+ transporter-C (MgtC) family protein